MGDIRGAGLGLLLSSLIAVVAYRRDSLSRSGALGAVVSGTVVFGLGGWTWGALLITFFVLSTALSRYRARAKERLLEKFAKGSRRDIGQVAANGGVGVVLALIYSLTHHPVLFFAFSGAMATVNADTWATELGVLAPRPPRLITSGQIVEPGTSGGVSRLGTLATLAGGAVMGLSGFGYLLLDGVLGRRGIADFGGRQAGSILIIAYSLGGLAGSVFDSLLGATVQAIYYSRNRRKETERAVDSDGTPNRLIRGYAWLSNDWVNLFSSIVGAAVSAAAYAVAAGVFKVL